MLYPGPPIPVPVSYTHLAVYKRQDQVHSLLDDIPGIGETRRKALMRKFKSVENIRDASLEELTATESMNAGSAQKVYEFFHGASVPTS